MEAGEVVRVGADTAPMGVARLVAEEVHEGRAVTLQAVGVEAVHRMVKGVALATSECGAPALWAHPSFEVVTMERGDERTAIRLEVRCWD